MLQLAASYDHVRSLQHEALASSFPTQAKLPNSMRQRTRRWKFSFSLSGKPWLTVSPDTVSRCTTSSGRRYSRASSVAVSAAAVPSALQLVSSAAFPVAKIALLCAVGAWAANRVRRGNRNTPKWTSKILQPSQTMHNTTLSAFHLKTSRTAGVKCQHALPMVSSMRNPLTRNSQRG